MISGGAGFIGVNAARHYAERDWRVSVFDDLSRAGAQQNLEWLRGVARFDFRRIDIRDRHAVEECVRELHPDVLLHLAAQVAVTTSVRMPREDFEVNALGTLNLLEAVRRFSPRTLLVNASTNKVYGAMADVAVEERDARYQYRDLRAGVDETQILDFHSPYGCSKGSADQYCLDYARIYGLRATSMRQSCIYGPHQFGVEDQGWVAWFAIAAVTGKPITIFGDGKQSRDILHVADLLDCYDRAIAAPEQCAGEAFNIGGGPANHISLVQLIALLESELQADIAVRWSDWRPGDQPVFVCDIAKARERLSWEPRISVSQGMGELLDWIRENRSLFE